MKKILLVLCLFFSFSLFKSGEVQASEVADTVYYDLKKGGTQEFITSDSEGRTMHIVVEEIPGISLFSLNNGSYRISGKKTGLWEASYLLLRLENGHIELQSLFASHNQEWFLKRYILANPYILLWEVLPNEKWC